MSDPIPIYAFPSFDSDGQRRDEGMLLRDYFAAKAMQALIFAPVEEWPDEVKGGGVSLSAFIIADKMMSERSK